jgi:hypothetical protein
MVSVNIRFEGFLATYKWGHICCMRGVNASVFSKIQGKFRWQRIAFRIRDLAEIL